MADERAQDRFDEAHYGTARAAGQIGGVVGSLLIPGGALVHGGQAIVRGGRLAAGAVNAAMRERNALEAARAFGRALTPTASRSARVAVTPRRISGAARSTAAERYAWLLGPGAGNAAVQLASDGLIERRLSSPEDLAGAFAGGVVGGRARGLGARRATALGAAATSLFQDGANRRPPSLERAGQAAVAGAYLGPLAYGAGQAWSNGLSRAAKGVLGERMGAVRSALNGRVRKVGKKEPEPVADTGRYTLPDGRSGPFLFEDKFGYWARLSHAQKLARRHFGDRYVIYHFTPDDVGRLAAQPAGFFASPVAGYLHDVGSRP